MRFRASVAASLLLVLAAPVVAQTPPPTPPPAPPSPAPKAEMTRMMRRFTDTMTGRPVIAVDPDWGFERWTDDEEAAVSRAGSDLEKLQALSAAYSDGNRSLIPFQVGAAYTVAPETRDTVNPDLSRLTPLDIANRMDLLTDVLTRLTPEQRISVGSSNGLAVAALPADMQREIARAFRPPMQIYSARPTVITDEQGLPQTAYGHDVIGNLDQPLDWTQSRIRARLRMNGATVSAGNQMGFISSGYGSGPLLEPAGGGDTSDDVPMFLTVPNTFKPSDLTGKPYPQPLGISGVRTVKQVVEQLSKVTGLALSVWEPYQNRPVFLGSEALRAGDALDALRLGLTAAWRKMGDAYYLVWDRIPLGAIAQSAREASAGATDALRKHNASAQTSAGYVALVETLPFADDDPLAPTDEQRRTLFGVSDPGEGAPRVRALSFADMTPEQQAYLRKQAASSTLQDYRGGPTDRQARAMTPDDVQRATLSGAGQIEVDVTIPGHGWAHLQNFGRGMHFSSFELEAARRKIAPEVSLDSLPDDVPAEVRAMLKDPKPVSLPSPVRGLVVPTLSASRLTTLADEMQRHGLNVLFYPALYGGYATFANSFFPLDPALRETDGLAAAVAAMTRKHIRVVAYLNTLAWQNDEDPVHWLNKHPDWLDVDVLGRGRLAFLKAHPESRKAANPFARLGPDPHNYVRATEPQVESRLTAFIRALAARPGVSAVALAAWQPLQAAPYLDAGLQAPRLGFAWPDRLAAFRKTGADPADIVANPEALPESVRGIAVRAASDTEDPDEARAALVARLIQTARAARKDWRVYLVNDNATPFGRPDGASKAPPARPDLTIASLFSTDPGSITGKGVLFPVAHKSVGEMLADGDDPAMTMMRNVLGGLSPVVLYNLALTEGSPIAARNIPMALYDFRDAPQIITDSLKWVKPPAK